MISAPLGTDQREQLARVCWLGGAPDAGKTTITSAIALRLHVPTYHYDQHDLRHHLRLAEQSQSYAAFLRAGVEENWVAPDPEALADRAWQSFVDRFPLVLEDLTALKLPVELPIIAEGFGLTPALVSPWLTQASNFVCLMPSEPFKTQSMERRGKGRFDGEVSDPALATANLLQRDMLLASRLRREAQDYGLDVIEVDGDTSAAEIAASLIRRFGLKL